MSFNEKAILDSLKRKELLKTILENRFSRWKVRDISETEINIEGKAYSLRVPAREYVIGWGITLDISSNEVKVSREYGWNTPSYAQNTGSQMWDPQEIPKQLKRKSWESTLPRVKDSFKKACECDIQLPNGLVSRWCTWTNEMVSWGEVPKKIREEKLSRTPMSWGVFLSEQEQIFGGDVKKQWQKKLLLLRDPHPTIIKTFETPETMAFRQERHEKIKQARLLKEGKRES